MKIIAYVGDGTNYEVNSGNFAKIDHVNYCFATIKDTLGNVNFGFKKLDVINSIKDKNENLKVSLSVGGWGAGNFSEMAESISTRSNFVSQIINFIDEQNWDGIDMDWEYPTFNSSGISSHYKDRENYTLLSIDIRNALDELSDKTGKKYYLSLAIGATESSLNSFELHALNKYYDFLNIMNYDYIGMDNVTCHHANLYKSIHTPNKNSAIYYMDMFEKSGFDRSKIVFGFPLYGRGADQVENKGNGLGNRITGEIPRFYDQTEVDKLILTNPQNVYYDKSAEASYYYDGKLFISYESNQSLKKKLEYIESREYCGVMFWEYALQESGELLNCLYDNLSK